MEARDTRPDFSSSSQDFSDMWEITQIDQSKEPMMDIGDRVKVAEDVDSFLASLLLTCLSSLSPVDILRLYTSLLNRYTLKLNDIDSAIRSRKSERKHAMFRFLLTFDSLLLREDGVCFSKHMPSKYRSAIFLAINDL